MKKYINLFVSKQAQEALSPIVIQARKYGFITLIALIVLLCAEIGGYFFLQTKIAALEEKQIVLASFVQTNKALEEKIAYFLFKKNLLVRFMRDDAQFSVYYDLFQDITSKAKLNVKLESFSVDKTRKTELTLSFDTYEEAQSFMKSIESPLFLDNFKELTISSFTVGTRKSITNEEIPVYRVELKGIFKEINENKS